MKHCPNCGAKLFRIKEREIWHIKLLGDIDLTCALVEELTAQTVVLRTQPDVGGHAQGAAARYDLCDVKFVERVP